ncbi:hypothetical protein [Candidatus Clostridium helianthi]|uniref:DUF3795 domain-containing protein n=1 Tax=Candidatus Clostridium helianthi TaxID=3381660 RepID=A0ABW8S3I0_9CLOT
MNKKSDLEQLSFFKHEGKLVDKSQIQYDATICGICLCGKCNKNCETHVSHMSKEECLALDEPCWNCDECYFYGMDDETLNKNIVRFKCDNFEMTKHFVDLYAQRQRKKFKIIAF